jgi:ABC-2 type transport system ATP-binding protein
VLDSRVRLEIKDGLRFVTTVAEAFPGTIQSVSISKPTLDDVFISRTGHRFWTEQEQQEMD